MSYPPTALLGDPPSRHVSEPTLPGSAQALEPPAAPRRAKLLLSVENADPTGQIALELDPHNAGTAAFSCRPDDVVVGIGAVGVGLEFIAVEARAVEMVIGADPDYRGGPVDVTLELVITASTAGGFSLRAHAAPGTGITAAVQGGPARSLTRGPAAWRI